MKYIHGTEDFTLDKDSAVTLGNLMVSIWGHPEAYINCRRKSKTK